MAHLQVVMPQVFQIAHLFFRGLYLPVNPRAVKWDETDRKLLVEAGGSWPKGFMAEPSVVPKTFPITFKRAEVPEFALKHYYGHNPSTYSQIRHRLGYVRDLDNDAGEFFRDVIDGRQAVPAEHIASRTLFEKCIDWLETIKPRTEIDAIDMDMLIDMYHELFISHFLWRRYRVATVSTAGVHLLRAYLLQSADVDLWDSVEAEAHWRQFIPARTIHEFIREVSGDVDAADFGELLIPDVASIPIAEIVKFVIKDHAQPIYDFIADLMTKHRGQLTHREVADEVVEQLWKITHVLWPSARDVAIGFLGNVPMPVLINPIGAVDWFRSAFKKRNLDREYKWVLAVNEISHFRQNRI